MVVLGRSRVNIDGKAFVRSHNGATDAVDKILQGSMESAVEIKRNDEIGIHAGGFNRMGSELQK